MCKYPGVQRMWLWQAGTWGGGSKSMSWIEFPEENGEESKARIKPYTQLSEF